MKTLLTNAMKLAHLDIFSTKVVTSAKREEKPNFADTTEGVYEGNPIRFNHVSNALHVMLGARPVSTKWKSPFGRERVQRIDDIAEKALIKITTPIFYNKQGDIKPHVEFGRGKSFVRNSNAKYKTRLDNTHDIDGVITWDTLRLNLKYQHPDNYKKVLDLIKECTGTEKPWEKYTFVEALRLMGDSPRRDEYADFFVSIGRKPLAQVIRNIEVYPFNDEKEVRVNSGAVNLAAYSINSNKIYKISFDGEIVIPMDDEDYKNLCEGTNVANILDGGVVILDRSKTTDYFNEDEFICNGYTKVSELK